MATPCLIVDGHSVIFQLPDLRELHARRSELARERLIETLRRYHESTGTHVVVVFDGKGRRTEQGAPAPGIQVFYSRTGQTADAVIERLTAKYAGSMDLRVATDDHLERTTVLALGGYPISVAELVTEVNRAEEELQQTLSQMRRRNRR